MLPTLREIYAPQFVIVNGENAAGGLGITPDIARGLLQERRRRHHAGQPYVEQARDHGLPGP